MNCTPWASASKSGIDMEKESFFTGYCRVIDQSRMGAAVTENGALTEVDCCFETCVHTPNCLIAKAIRELLNEGETK